MVICTSAKGQNSGEASRVYRKLDRRKVDVHLSSVEYVYIYIYHIYIVYRVYIICVDMSYDRWNIGLDKHPYLKLRFRLFRLRASSAARCLCLGRTSHVGKTSCVRINGLANDPQETTDLFGGFQLVMGVPPKPSIFKGFPVFLPSSVFGVAPI